MHCFNGKTKSLAAIIFYRLNIFVETLIIRFYFHDFDT